MSLGPHSRSLSVRSPAFPSPPPPILPDICLVGQVNVGSQSRTVPGGSLLAPRLLLLRVSPTS